MSDIAKGFKEFVLRGNVIDLAVGFVVGLAFAALITNFNNSFIQPIIRSILGGGDRGGLVHLRGNNYLDFGSFITAVITFVLTLAVLYFVFVVPMNALRARRATGQEEAIETELDLLRQIRDSLNRPGGTPTA
jgi:large conductance mechanosensitive channel